MELTGQILSFVITLATGMLLGILFDCYRVLRGTFKPKVFITWIADLLYWLVATVVVFIALVVSNWGELRLYVFIGILSGVAIYYRFLSLYAIGLFSNIIKVIRATVDLVKKIFMGILLRPVLYCIKIVSWPLLFVGRKTRVWYQSNKAKPPDDEIK